MKVYPAQVLFREYFEGILAAIFLALFLRFFVLSVLYIPTDNMEPTLQRGDFVLGWRLVYGFPLPLMKGERLNAKNPARGDLVSFRFPGDEEQLIIRRVVALGGDKVEVLNGRLLVNGVEAPLVNGASGQILESAYGSDETYSILPSDRGDLAAMQIPDGHVFVLSDNRGRTDDSRDWGTVPVNNIESRLGFIWLSVRSDDGGLNLLWSRVFNFVH